MLKKFNSKNLILDNFKSIRSRSLNLVSNLSPDDMNIQSDIFVSPTKWHLAHTTWFFEKIILRNFLKNYKPFNKKYDFIFNSYYQSLGKQFSRDKRGLLSRPDLEEVFNYRLSVDERVEELLTTKSEDVRKINFLMKTGINHEQQHQELILMDIQYNFFQNPLMPKYSSHKDDKKLKKKIKRSSTFKKVLQSIDIIGATNKDFSFDNENPSFKKKIDEFNVHCMTVTNGEWREFIKNGIYQKPQYWLSDGFEFITKNNINKPLYWLDNNYHFTLNGVKKIRDDFPVSNISFYEADAFAKWKNMRLPSEFEMEYLIKNNISSGNFMESGIFEPTLDTEKNVFKNLWGNQWEWTNSFYLPYKGFKTWDGHLSEYNGKFMFNQIVLKGGSCLTPKSHFRPSYRNFFYPTDRWVCNGFRLVK